jgi:hypothetical protein
MSTCGELNKNGGRCSLSMTGVKIFLARAYKINASVFIYFFRLDNKPYAHRMVLLCMNINHSELELSSVLQTG